MATRISVIGVGSNHHGKGAEGAGRVKLRMNAVLTMRLGGVTGGTDTRGTQAPGRTMNIGMTLCGRRKPLSMCGASGAVDPT